MDKEEKRKEVEWLLANDKDFGDEWQDTEEDFQAWLDSFDSDNGFKCLLKGL